MSRHLVGLAPAMLLAAGWLTWGLAETAIPAPAQVAAPEKPPVDVPLKRGKELRAALARRFDLEKGIEANTPLKDVLEFITSRTGVQFILDSKAFEAIGVQKAEEQPVILPVMRGVRLDRILGLLLGQIRGDVYTGGIVVRGDYVEVTSTYEVLVAAAGKLALQVDNNNPNANPPMLTLPPIVHIDFNEHTLQEALEALADAASVNVILDPRIADKAKKPVTGTFNNLFAETAIHLLADMADLRAVKKDAAFYITTKENARVFEKLHKPATPPAGAVEPGVPVPNGGGAPPM